jgi:hypothetical protein
VAAAKAIRAHAFRWMVRDVSLPMRILDEISELDRHLAANMIVGNLDDFKR